MDALLALVSGRRWRITSRKTAGAGWRERRTFSAEFNAEAVRLVTERRAASVTLGEIGQELAVRPDELRTCTRQARTAPRAGGAVPRKSLDQEVRRLRREVAVLRQEQAFAKKCGDLNRSVQHPQFSWGKVGHLVGECFSVCSPLQPIPSW